MNNFVDPIPSLVEGLLKGHQLGLQMRNQRMAEEAAKQKAALEEQQMSMQDIMNRNMLQQHARPVNAGVVENPAGPDMPSEVPGLPPTPGAPAYQRKADRSRVVKYGGQEYELKTPEEQAAEASSQQISGMQALENAKAQAAANTAAIQRRNQLQLEGGGVPAPAGLEGLGYQAGTPLTRAELAQALDTQQGLRKSSQLVVRPGETVYDTSTPAAAPEQEPNFSTAMPAGLTPTQVLPANLRPQGSMAQPPLAGNPTAERMRVIASGGPANPTGENAEFRSSYLPGWLQQRGITTPQPKDEYAAYQDFLKQKKQPEWAANEVELAQRAAKGDKAAQDALDRLAKQKQAERPVNNFNIGVPGLGPGTASAAHPELTGEEFMKTIPAGTAAQVRAIAEGRAAMPSGSSRAAGAQQIRDAVFRFDPSYTDQRAQVRRAFTTGKDGTNIGNLNTAAVHLDQMVEAATAMHNGSWQPGNQLYNYIATKFGAAAPTNYQFVMNAFGGEAANALKGTATDPEIAHVLGSLKPEMSPDQALGVGHTALHVLGAKLNTYQERYQQQIPGDTVWSPVLPSARAVFQKYGMTETGATPAPPQHAGRGGVGGGTPGAGLPRGAGKAADAGVIKQFLDANGGDKDAARKALGDYGWTIPKAQ